MCRSVQKCRWTMCRPAERVVARQEPPVVQVRNWAIGGGRRASGQFLRQARLLLDEAMTARLLRRCTHWACDWAESHPVFSLTQRAAARNSMRAPSSYKSKSTPHQTPCPLLKMLNIVLTINERCLKEICPVSQNIY